MEYEILTALAPAIETLAQISRAYSSVAERLTADQQVSSSTLDAPSFIFFNFVILCQRHIQLGIIHLHNPG